MRKPDKKFKRRSGDARVPPPEISKKLTLIKIGSLQLWHTKKIDRKPKAVSLTLISWELIGILASTSIDKYTRQIQVGVNPSECWWCCHKFDKLESINNPSPKKINNFVKYHCAIREDKIIRICYYGE